VSNSSTRTAAAPVCDRASVSDDKSLPPIVRRTLGDAGIDFIERLRLHQQCASFASRRTAFINEPEFLLDPGADLTTRAASVLSSRTN
jgi:hypothetical protein